MSLQSIFFHLLATQVRLSWMVGPHLKLVCRITLGTVWINEVTMIDFSLFLVRLYKHLICIRS